MLVVDDEPAIRALVAKIVERSGHDVDTAADGQEAIGLLNEHDYAVIVLDLMMPHIDGYELIEHIKSTKGQRPAIIVVSAGESAQLRKLDGSVVHSVVRKPFDIEVLGDLIGAAARSSAEHGALPDVLPFRRDNAC
ncbi:MAG TPA: response regulator [Thermoanaerobaculia bacterium]